MPIIFKYCKSTMNTFFNNKYHFAYYTLSPPLFCPKYKFYRSPFSFSTSCWLIDNTIYDISIHISHIQHFIIVLNIVTQRVYWYWYWKSKQFYKITISYWRNKYNLHCFVEYNILIFLWIENFSYVLYCFYDKRISVRG